MGPLALVGHLVGIQVRVVEDHARPVADAAQRVARRIHPHLVAADGAQLIECAVDRGPLLPGVGADADQVAQEAGLAVGHDFGESRHAAGKIMHIHRGRCDYLVLSAPAM